MTTFPDAPPIGGAFKLGYAEVTPSFKFGGTLDNSKLEEKHAPRSLSEVVGQSDAIAELSDWLANPHPIAFLLHGPTGTGKSTVARIVAATFGLDKHSPDYHEITSGTQDGASVETILDSFRFAPWNGGWRVVVVEESDRMTEKASHLWLSALDHIPSKTVILFTTNDIGKFPDRFLHRCIRLQFKGDARSLKQDAQTLINSVWSKEMGTDAEPPDFNDLPDLIDRSGLLSFRNVVASLGPRLRALKRTMPAGPATVAMSTPVGPPTVPVVASKPFKMPGPKRAVVKPPTVNPGPLKRSARDTRDWNDLIARREVLEVEREDLEDECVVVYDRWDRTKQLRAEAPRGTKSTFDTILRGLDDDKCRLGSRIIEIDAELKLIRADLKRLEP